MGQVVPYCQRRSDAPYQRRVLLSNLFYQAAVARFHLGSDSAALHADGRADVAKKTDVYCGCMTRNDRNVRPRSWPALTSKEPLRLVARHLIGRDEMWISAAPLESALAVEPQSR